MFVLIQSLRCGLSLFLVSMVATPLSAQQAGEIEQGYPGIRVEQVVAGLGVPWGMAFLSPDQLLLTERAGIVRLLDMENGSSVNLSGTPEVIAEGQGGMLDVAIGPNYAAEGWIYFTYTKRSRSEAATTLARAPGAASPARLGGFTGHRFSNRRQTTLRQSHCV
jgi:glucose/arabinose dehydrogenase